MLTVRLTKLSDERHLFAFTRGDGSGERIELVTRSFLLHDFIHFAIESEARLSHSFYGSLARGANYTDLTMGEMGAGQSEAAITEGVVGPFTPVAKGEMTPAQFIASRTAAYAPFGREPPVWLTLEFAERVMGRLRRLRGEWKATPFGGTMVLRFDA